MGSRRRLQLLAQLGLAALVAAHAAPARADIATTVNAIRADGCGGKRGPQPALRADAALGRAAEALAAGRDFKDAMAASGYRAVRSAMLEVTGDGDAAIGKALAARGCKDIAEPAYRDLGVAARPGRAWVVLGAPLEPPAAADSAAVSRRVLALVNAARADARRCGWKRYEAAPPLALSVALGRAARAQADDMA